MRFHELERGSSSRAQISIAAFLGCLALSFQVASPASAQEPIRLTRTSEPIQIDGVIDEAQWQKIAPVPMVMYQPTYGGDMTERTDIRLAYDENFIYMAASLYMDKAEDIRGRSLYRDRYAGDDLLAIVIDSFDDNETALIFYTNPLGTHFDEAISDDASRGRRSLNANWNTYWNVATTRTDAGWFAEIRIPFTSLKFQDDDGVVIMGLIAYRYLAVKNERHIYPDIPPDWPFALLKPSLAQDMILEGVYSRNPVYITPYASGGIDRAARLSSSEAAYESDTDHTNEFGANIKYNLTNNLTLDGTINTDFAQVEADDQRLNLERFSLFFPEKRQFFLERAGIFEFGLDSSNRLFHSRRIGLVDGTPVRILGGVRMVGRVGKWDTGLLELQTASVDSLPAENFGVLRFRRQLLNPYSNVGGIVTSRLGENGSRNVVYGLDGVLRLFGDEYLSAKWAQSFERDDKGVSTPAQSGRAYLNWRRREHQGLSYAATLSWAGKKFEPGLGFEQRRDLTFLENDLQYRWFLNKESKFRLLSTGNTFSTFLRNEDGEVESAYLGPSLYVESKTGTNFWIETQHSYEDVPDSFALADDVDVGSGSYWFHAVATGFRASRAYVLRPEGSIGFGQFYDGRKLTLRLGPGWTGSKYLQLQANYDYNRIRFAKRDQGFSAHIARLRAQGAVNRQLSLTAFFQYSNAADLVGVNARVRYHFKEGNDLWLVYDEDINTLRNQTEGPRLPTSDRRALLLKYTYTFIQ